jgi:hypothetical protein
MINSIYWIICAITVPHAVEECHLRKAEAALCHNHGGMITRNLAAKPPEPQLECADGKTFFNASWCFSYSEDKCEKE